MMAYKTSHLLSDRCSQRKSLLRRFFVLWMCCLVATVVVDSFALPLLFSCLPLSWLSFDGDGSQVIENTLYAKHEYRWIFVRRISFVQKSNMDIGRLEQVSGFPLTSMRWRCHSNLRSRHLILTKFDIGYGSDQVLSISTSPAFCIPTCSSLICLITNSVVWLFAIVIMRILYIRCVWRIRRARKRCCYCGYDLRYLFPVAEGVKCPECGRADIRPPGVVVKDSSRDVGDSMP